jgi:hypothetical protein
MKINLKNIAVVLVSTFLSACGGGGISVAGIGDGITGTGITAGSVTGFGSICLNGIKFDVKDATFSRDGIESLSQGEFNVGEYIVIKGSVNGAVGIAEEVIFEDLLEGVVTKKVSSVDGNSIEVLGQRVEIDINTTILIDDREDSPPRLDKSLSVCESPNILNFSLTELGLGYIVEISGLKDSTGLIKATSIKLKAESGSENELKGTISNIKLAAETFMIEDIIVDYSVAILEHFNGDPENGQFVEVKSTSAYDGTKLIADKVELKDEYLVIETGTELEMKGIVTRHVSKTDFDVNGIPVTTNSETEYKNGVASDIFENTPLEVKGKINNSGILVAQEIDFED